MREKKKAKREKPPGRMKAHFIKLKSISDLARCAATFGDGVHPIFAIEQKEKRRLFVPGMKVGDARFVYYFDTGAEGNTLVYQPTNIAEGEITELKKGNITPQQMGRQENIPIIEMMQLPFDEEKKEKLKAVHVKMKDCDSLVKGVISKSIEHNSIGRIFAFQHQGKRHAGSFTLLGDEDDTVFCYAEAPTGKEFSFFRYNYSTDKVEPTETFGEHSFLYVRVINLAEPFGFFKPE